MGCGSSQAQCRRGNGDIVAARPPVDGIAVESPTRTHQLSISQGELLALGIIASLLTVCVSASYSEMQERAQQVEARTNLSSIFVYQVAFFGEYGRFSDFDEIQFSPNEPTRYTYRAMKTRLVWPGLVSSVLPRVAPGPVQVLKPTIGLVTPENTVVAARSSVLSFTATATANLDDDPTFDQWHVNDIKEGLERADVDDLAVITTERRTIWPGELDLVSESTPLCPPCTFRLPITCRCPRRGVPMGVGVK